MEKLSYEEASKQLESIISKLESGNISMSESMALFEEGKKLTKICYEHLEKAKGKLVEVKEVLGKLIED